MCHPARKETRRKPCPGAGISQGNSLRSITRARRGGESVCPPGEAGVAQCVCRGMAVARGGHELASCAVGRPRPWRLAQAVGPWRVRDPGGQGHSLNRAPLPALGRSQRLCPPLPAQETLGHSRQRTNGPPASGLAGSPASVAPGPQTQQSFPPTWLPSEFLS